MDKQYVVDVKKRVIALFFCCSTGIVLLLSLYLTPDPAGIGTHKQLGLEECGFVSLFEIPCMMCGMTTSFSYYGKMHFWQGFVNQPFSFVLWWSTVFVFVLSFLDFLRPNERLLRIFIHVIASRFVVGAVLLAMMLCSWIYKIIIFL